jgi:FtsP/CotA-like multicopper oxidase with cupredoxin domain
MSHASTIGCPHVEPHSQVEFATDQPQEGSPETEFRKTPTWKFLRKFFNAGLTFPDGVKAEIWSFEDETSGRCLPAPLIRAREGDIVHVTLKPSKGAHTIHLHGIEPDPRNDGVGHTSFEVTGEYTYQFKPQIGSPGDPNVGAAGSYFYHCHVNTVLHVQMGMFGPMIIDPSDGRGKVFNDDPVGYDPRAETLLVPYSIDPRWHTLNHAAGLGGEDVGLNRFEPKHFYLLGGDLNGLGPAAVKTVREILAPAPVAGQKPGLLRVTNANYFPTQLRFLGGLSGEVIAHDGRALRNTLQAPYPPVSASTTLLSFGAAERYDIRLRPPATARARDTFDVAVDWLHWITGKVIATRTTKVRII